MKYTINIIVRISKICVENLLIPGYLAIFSCIFMFIFPNYLFQITSLYLFLFFLTAFIYLLSNGGGDV